MADRFPLSLPAGTCAVSLPWHDRNDDQAWLVEAAEAVGHTSTWTFGKTMYGRHLCLHRFKLWWLKPSHGHSGLNVPPETALLLAERRPPLPGTSNTCGTTAPPPPPPLRQQQQRQQEYVVLLPVSDTRARANLHRAGDKPSSSSSSGAVREHDPSALAVSADTGDAATPLPGKLGLLLVATGPDPFRLVRRLVLEATERLRAQLLSLSPRAEGERRPAAGADADAAGAGVAGGGVAVVPHGDGSARDGDDRGDIHEPEHALVASFLDTFGWCTWDSFYTMVTPEGVLEGLSTLRQGGVRPRWVVLDDGWQSTTNDDALNTEQWDERLVRFEANKRFRRLDEEGKVVLDLGDTVKRMKENFGVEQVLAWHAMTGYWAGVEPEAPEMAVFGPHLTELSAPKGIREVDPEMQPELDEKRFGMVKPAQVEGFYRAYHSYLKANGVDGVKVDAQSIIDCMGGGNGGVPVVAREYHQGLCRSVQGTFKEGGRPAALIHCMCHAPSVLFLIACVSQDRVVLRGSDDFYPREPNSHGPHLYSNAFNALLLANLGVQDWDMFQTGLGLEAGTNAEHRTGAGETAAAGRASLGGGSASCFHAAARAISGGPVYVSDRPGQHNRDILSRLVLDDGSVLRASTNALPTLDCLFRDPQQDGGGLLQVWALNPLPGTGVVGSFNIQGASFSQSERTWVRHHHNDPGDDDALSAAAAALAAAGGGGVVKGTVSPADVHAFRPTKRSPTTRASGGCCAAFAEAAGRSSPGGGGLAGQRGGSRGRADDDDAGEGSSKKEEQQGEGKGEESEADSCCYAVYLHRRREARVVGLHEAVEVEAPPLGFELATFSRIVELRSSPSAAAAAAAATGATTAASQSQEVRGRVAAGVVRWAALGLSAMFNSSAAVTAQQATTGDGDAFAPPQRSHPLGGGGGTEASREKKSDDGTARTSGGDCAAAAAAAAVAGAGVSLAVKGSGAFLAVASRKPASVLLYGARGGGGGVASSESGGAGGKRLSDDQGGDGGGGGSKGFDDGGVDGGSIVVLQATFTALSICDESTNVSRDEAGTGAGGPRMGLVEVDIPGPWDGRERRLVFRWL